MTVGELIVELSKHPRDRDVLIWNDDYGYWLDPDIDTREVTFGKEGTPLSTFRSGGDNRTVVIL